MSEISRSQRQKLSRTPHSEAYRRLLLMMGARLRLRARPALRTAERTRPREEFRDDLDIIRRSLCDGRRQRAGGRAA